MFFKDYKIIMYRKVIKASKACDIEQTLKNSDNFSKAVWNLINSARSKECRGAKPLYLKLGNSIVKDPHIVSNELNIYFPRSLNLMTRPLGFH